MVLQPNDVSVWGCFPLEVAPHYFRVMFYLFKYSKDRSLSFMEAKLLHSCSSCTFTHALLVTAIPKNQFQHNLTAVLLHLMASVW